MAHTVTDGGLVIVDWTTGDPEGDRAHVFRAYRAFLADIKRCVSAREIRETFEHWKVTDLNVDDFPRISIEFPTNH